MWEKEITKECQDMFLITKS
jgi:hypothetical protein